MKTLKFKTVSVLAVCLLVVSISASATGLRTEFKAYEISTVDDLYVGKNVNAIWTLSYSAEETPITVVKRTTAGGAEYVVRSKFFEVSYAATAAGFGTKNVRSSWSNVPKKITKAVLNQEEMKRQQVITPNKVDDETALGLIASYLPDLVNDGYTHILN
jgi:hypothetical protein